MNSRQLFQLHSLALVCCLLMGCQDKSEQPAPAPTPKVDGNSVILVPGSHQIDFIKVEEAAKNQNAVTPITGRVTWSDDATVRVYTPVAGRVEKILADLGQKVVVEAPLAVISSPDFGQAQSDAAKADSDVRLAKKVLARDQDLLAHGAAAAKDVEADQSDLESKQAELQRAMAALNHYGGKLGQIDESFILKSPIAGTIVEKNVNPGQQVRNDAILANIPQGYQPLFVVSNPDTLWLYLDVTEVELSKLKVGQKLRLKSRAFPDKDFDGAIVSIGQELDPVTRTLKVRGEVANPDHLLRAEMYVNAELENTPTGGVIIPSKALFRSKDENCVFIEHAPGEYERKQVVTGPENNGLVEVAQGLQIGDRVVVEGALSLENIIDGGGG